MASNRIATPVEWELYKALHKAVAVCPRCFGSGAIRRPVTDDKVPCPVCASWRAALALAEGQTSLPNAADSDADGYSKALAEEADRRGTSIEIHRCPQGDWIIGFGEGLREVLAQEADFGNALFAATILRKLAANSKAGAR